MAVKKAPKNKAADSTSVERCAMGYPVDPAPAPAPRKFKDPTRDAMGYPLKPAGAK